jgi:hypothetical protein
MTAGGSDRCHVAVYPGIATSEDQTGRSAYELWLDSSRLLGDVRYAGSLMGLCPEYIEAVSGRIEREIRDEGS